MIQSIHIDWPAFKSYLNSNLVTFKMIETSVSYSLYLADGSIVASCLLPKDGGDDQTDFENNYKARANIEFPCYSTVLNITQTTTTAANNTVFAMRNAVGSGKIVVIKKILLNMSFDQGTPLAGPSSLRYYLCGFSSATPTGGTAQTVAPLVTANPTSVVTDVRFANTGLTTAGVAFGNAVCGIGLGSAAGASSNLRVREPGIKLLAGEGLAIRLGLVAVNGQALTGGIIWREV